MKILFSAQCIILGLLIFAYGCKKNAALQLNENLPTEEENPPEKEVPAAHPIRVFMHVGGVSFEEDKVNNEDVFFPTRQAHNKPDIQNEAVNLDGIFTLHTQLNPVANNFPVRNASFAAHAEESAFTKAVVNTGDLHKKIKYKVVVFDAFGKFVTQKDYVYATENKGGGIGLKSATKYTFIAFSVNSPDELPSLDFSDRTMETLENAQLNNLTGTADFLYFKKEIILSKDSIQKLKINFKHKFSQLTFIINTARTGYMIKDVPSMVASNCNVASVQLATGKLVAGSAQAGIDVKFNGSQASTLTSLPIFINPDKEGKSNLNITRISIGPYSFRNISIFKNLTFKPGTKYTLQVNIDNPDDVILKYKNYPAVQINGKIWMQHNLGADYNADPEIQRLAVHGDYYQWGRNVPFCNGGSIVDDSKWLISYNRQPNCWNIGTEERPEKSAKHDPCPAGYRVPTETEVKHLVENTVISNIGKFEDKIKNYSAAKVLTSKRNSKVKIYFPVQGNFSYYAANTNIEPLYRADGVTKRGEMTFLWTSTSTKERPVSDFEFEENNAYWSSDNTSRAPFKCMGFNIRCIAE
ncbi:hypothetical protein ACL9RF_08755 [Sphingobacterium sp. Mn56C]|uniref:hypothetical protein n=1 Tax=Sphingobacterium sp. Mn56C TaxID=3395261 RepID=UPI003BD426E5